MPRCKSYLVICCEVFWCFYHSSDFAAMLVMVRILVPFWQEVPSLVHSSHLLETKLALRRRLSKKHLEIICYACALLHYWAGLYTEMDKEQPVEGANLMLQVAKGLLASQNAGQASRLQLTDGEPHDPEEDSAYP